MPPLSNATHITARDVDLYLQRHMSREPGTKIQYGHPSPRFWQRANPKLADVLAPIDPNKPLNLYLHIPFCPPTDPEACGFCLFAREDYRNYRIVDAYMANLKTELRAVAASLGRRTLHTLYFGGGTPNILTAAAIRDIFATLHELFDIPPACETTFEGTPGLFTQDRLEALRDVGVTRISVGAQTLKPHLIKHSGRKQKPEHIERTAKFAKKHGIRCSVDLITGWFDQTPEDVVDDIELLHAWGATGIVNHPLTLGGDSPFSRKKHELPPVQVTCESFMAARERLFELGYRADGYTDYCASDMPPVAFLTMYRQVLLHDRVGVGYGANSLLTGSLDNPGHTYRNVVGTGPYNQRVAEQIGNGGSCVDSRFGFDRVDLQLLYVLKGLEGFPYLSASDYEAVFGTPLYEDFAPWWDALGEREWLEWNDGQPRLVNDGIFYTSEVQRCLSWPRNDVLRQAA